MIKIERVFTNQFNRSGISVCKKLLRRATNTESDDENEIGDEPEDIILHFNTMKHRKIVQETGKYIDQKFIIGSVAGVERLWS